MKKFNFVILLSALLLISGCKSDELDPVVSAENPKNEELMAEEVSDVMKGILRVKLTPETEKKLRITRTEGMTRSGQSEIDAYLEDIGAVEMKRLFPPAGKFESRTRKEGLHLWYEIIFDKTKPMTRAVTEAKKLPGVEIVEEVFCPILPPAQAVSAPFVEQTRGGENPFNDPGLGNQWHYHNTGAFQSSKVGADINLFKAWEKEVGKPNVIVAIVDGGIDVKHEDLKDNIHVNLAELNGSEGVDDDGNGFVDDIYGYNFVQKKGAIVPVEHGTHVAGTVAARNNNGIGVCGIAGGDGSEGSGVRLMSCQIFMENSNGNSAAAIKYAADNGAVISQNSWGYRYPGPGDIPSSEKAAIDYFIKYAGCDNDGNQLPDSPMKGGVVIFAAGNDGQDYLAYPAAYPPVVSVSSMAPDFKKAFYTNRGDWISVMAPGGDQNYYKGEVYSTLPNNRYGYMQGTSMACPHVSGIAALIVSKLGKMGFTNQELKERLTNSFRPVNIDKMNPGFEGRLGKGYIDAASTMAVNNNKKPAQVKDVQVKEDFTSLLLTWNVVPDEDDGSASMYKIYYSDKGPLNANNYENNPILDVNGIGYKAGEEITYNIESLPLNTQFYFAIVAEDRWGLTSAPTFFSAKTKENFAPIIKRENDKPIKITAGEVVELKLNVKDPEGQKWTYSVKGQQQGVSFAKKDYGLLLKFRAIAPIGKYSLSVEVVDIFNAKATLSIPFEVYENHPPKQIKEFNKIFIPINKSDYKLDLSEFFEDEDGHVITYSARSLNPSIAGVSMKDNILTFNPAKLGSVYLEISATDVFEAKTRVNLQVQIVKDVLVYSIYPVPVKDVLNLRLNDKVKEATIIIHTPTGAQVFKQNVTASTPEQRLVKLDLSNISGGNYILTAEANGETYKQSFIKL